MRKHFSVFLQESQLFFGWIGQLMRPTLEFHSKCPTEFHLLLQDLVVESLQISSHVTKQPLMHQQQPLTGCPIAKTPRHRVLCGRRHQLLLELGQKRGVFR